MHAERYQQGSIAYGAEPALPGTGCVRCAADPFQFRRILVTSFPSRAMNREISKPHTRGGPVHPTFLRRSVSASKLMYMAEYVLFYIPDLLEQVVLDGARPS